jgi:2-methylcitrate dehydratase PrpD
MSENTRITAEAATFAASLSYDAIPPDALKVGRRCMIDGIGQFVAGSTTEPVAIVAKDAREQGGREEALLLGGGSAKVPATLAARVLGTAGHALDWDDTQASKDPRHTYGLLTHPTVPPLAAALAMAQKLGAVSGRDFMTAFQAGFEVECKIAEWMLPEAYKRGLHASAAEGTIGAAVTAGKLLKLDADTLRYAIGIAASCSAAGIRANVGTMTKPLHFGAAAENGIMAAQLAARGLEANASALDGAYGFLTVFSGGVFEEKLAQGFGKTFSIVDPGVAIKPYPSGILTHQAMDAMLALVTENDIAPEDVDSVVFHAGSNVLKPISYAFAADHLEAKFCVPALLAMIVLKRQAGQNEFSDTFVQSPAMADMQRRITTMLDPDIEAQGFDKIRSRIVLTTKTGETVERRADECYRGSPDNPMTDAEVEDKYRICTDGILPAARQKELLAAIWAVDAEQNDDAGRLAALMQP